MKIKIIIFDFDGVFTNGNCYFDNNNNIKKYYNIKDGMSLKILRDNGTKIGLISSYSTKKDIYLNENKIDYEIINHLNFDYKYIGKGNKLEILNRWLEELNLSYDDVAYIGDDINDLEIMNLIRFSACPNDAVDDCKKNVNYICEKKGGEGCVREFVEKVLMFNSSKEVYYDSVSPIINEIKQEFNFQIDNFKIDDIVKLSNTIESCNGNIYICGVGKSGNIAKHFCDLLKCISFPSFYLDILNTTHGDIGTLNESDIIIMFSNSGNTHEIINLIPLFKNIGSKTIGICCNKQSKFNELCDSVIITPFNKEISGEIDKIPTNSYMSHLLFSNIMVSYLKKNINLDRYKKNHLSGSIGKQLLKVKDVMITDFPKILLEDKIEMNIVLLEMTKYKIGCCFFVNNENELLGILTDGDIRRLLIKNKDIQYINIDHIINDYYYESNINNFVNKKYYYYPILKKKKIIGIVNLLSQQAEFN